MRFRSVLFAPGDDERKLRGALQASADAVIADLEDAVAWASKPKARRVVARVFGEAAQVGVRRFVRVNSEPGLLEDDLRALEGLDLDGLVLPKATPDGAAALEPFPLIAIVETAKGLVAVGDIARGTNVVALLLGSLDLSVELRLQARPDGLELLVPSVNLVVASAAADISGPLDGVHRSVDDLAGLEARARVARSLGFAGKACIHPRQVPVVNSVFTPTPAEIEEAQAVVVAYEQALSTGTGAVAHEGRMVDLPIFKQARQLLDHAADVAGRR